MEEQDRCLALFLKRFLPGILLLIFFVFVLYLVIVFPGRKTHFFSFEVGRSLRAFMMLVDFSNVFLGAPGGLSACMQKAGGNFQGDKFCRAFCIQAAIPNAGRFVWIIMFAFSRFSALYSLPS